MLSKRSSSSVCRDQIEGAYRISDVANAQALLANCMQFNHSCQTLCDRVQCFHVAENVKRGWTAELRAHPYGKHLAFSICAFILSTFFPLLLVLLWVLESCLLVMILLLSALVKGGFFRSCCAVQSYYSRITDRFPPCWFLFDSFDCSFKRVHIKQRSESKRICTTAYRDDECL
ncbi:hypothetical protein D917_09038 [Trichinella nativa]|uniref:Uncharacterized protein n=1 Tax=Trichinella nativa TaxID=6335 RepID=A0A1Y3EHQ7_9BILA|nr:hypothetical protein D917_09038 [Trichinella nativa]